MKVDSKIPSENMQNIYLKYYLVPLSLKVFKMVQTVVIRLVPGKVLLQREAQLFHQKVRKKFKFI